MRYLVAAVLVLVAGRAHGGDFAMLSAAAAADPSVAWQPASILSGDFTCAREREFAVLGTKRDAIVVAVFRPPATNPIAVLRFSGVERSPDSAVLAIEPLNFDARRMKEEVGYVPDGLKPSKTCAGLNLSDQKVDSAHIYWHRRHRRFESWSL